MGLPVLGQGDGAGAAGGKGGSQAGRGLCTCNVPSCCPRPCPHPRALLCTRQGAPAVGTQNGAHQLLPRKQLSLPQPQGIWDPPA